MQIASVTETGGKKLGRLRSPLPRDPRQSDAEAMKLSVTTIFITALAELIQLLGAGKINAFFDQPTPELSGWF